MTSAIIIDGKARAERLRASVAEDAAKLLAEHGLRPGLAVILVGDDPASAVYVRSKGEQSREAGFHSVTHRLAGEATQDEVEDLVRALNSDPAIHGILVQMPLPKGMDEQAVLGAVDPLKDVDGLTPVSAGRLANGQAGLVPCTPRGCLILLEEAVGSLSGKRAVVLGRSVLVGRPVAQLLLRADCTVTIAHSRTRDLAALCREADILVAAVGRPEMVRGEWIRPGAAVIDVGINRVPHADPVKAAKGKTRLVGDVAFGEVSAVAGWLTPVPGGVGPMTVACLLQNTLDAAKQSVGLG